MRICAVPQRVVGSGPLAGRGTQATQARRAEPNVPDWSEFWRTTTANLRVAHAKPEEADRTVVGMKDFPVPK